MGYFTTESDLELIFDKIKENQLYSSKFKKKEIDLDEDLFLEVVKHIAVGEVPKHRLDKIKRLFTSHFPTNDKSLISTIIKEATGISVTESQLNWFVTEWGTEEEFIDIRALCGIVTQVYTKLDDLYFNVHNDWVKFASAPGQIYISSEDIVRVLKVTPRKAKQMIREIDIDGDGKISFVELLRTLSFVSLDELESIERQKSQNRGF